MPNVGPTELIILLVIVLLVVGPKKLPAIGRSLGTGMREFKDSVTGGSKDDDAYELGESRPSAPIVPAEPAQPAQPVTRDDDARPTDQQ